MKAMRATLWSASSGRVVVALACRPRPHVQFGLPYLPRRAHPLPHYYSEHLACLPALPMRSWPCRTCRGVPPPRPMKAIRATLCSASSGRVVVPAPRTKGRE